MKIQNLDDLESKMGECWQEILSRQLASEIQKILGSGDKKLYAMWLSQVAHMTQHTSAHQALVGTRINEITHIYAKFCFEHALEEVGHELMAINDLSKLGIKARKISDLPAPLSATQKLNAYLYFVAERAHPATRLGFSYWAEKCYPFINSMAMNTKDALGLENHQMTFFVSHAAVDEKHAMDVEKIIGQVCKTPEDWEAVATGMADSLAMAVNIFEEIHEVVTKADPESNYHSFLSSL